jgi:hypothetical protein
MESAIEIFVKVAQKIGESHQEIADRVADALFNASDKQIKITAIIEDE